jgi:hypothetical protein
MKTEETGVIFFHGLESSSKSDKAKFLEQNYNGYCPDMDYTDPSLFKKMYDEIIKRNPRLLIGSSMGGWFAYCMSSLTGIKTLLMNPAVHSRSMEPKINLGNTPSRHTVILGKSDDVINPLRTKQWFSKNGIGEFEYHMENIGHRTPLEIMRKHIEGAINEEWSTESPIGPDMSFLPEGLAGDLQSNFLASRPFQGGFLAVENLNECAQILLMQECLNESDINFIQKAHHSPIDVFYEYLVKRGYFISKSEIERYWNDEVANSRINNLKDLVKRPRPYWIFDTIKTFEGVISPSYSFPSAHASLAWTTALGLSKKYPHLTDALETIARKISESRVQAGVHYPSDIKAGEMIARKLNDING